jgi:hypothetical protein
MQVYRGRIIRKLRSKGERFTSAKTKALANSQRESFSLFTTLVGKNLSCELHCKFVLVNFNNQLKSGF